jgi:hypothetical protein
VDDPSEPIATAEGTHVGGPARSVVQADPRVQGDAAVRPGSVVMLDVELDHLLQVSPTEDEHPVQALRPDRAGPPLGEGVGLRCPDGRRDDLGPVGAEDLVEARGVLGVPVPDQESDAQVPILKVKRDIPALLGDPG